MMRKPHAYTYLLLGSAMSLLALDALAQDHFPELRIEGEFLPYSASAPMESYDVIHSGPEFVPPGQRLRIERSEAAGEHGFLWTWLAPLHPELCSHAYWQPHCSEAGPDQPAQPVSVPVRVTAMAAEGTPTSTTSLEFSEYWRLGVIGLKRGETVFRIQSDQSDLDVWAYATLDGYLALTPRLLPRWDRSLIWQLEPRPARGIQVLIKVSAASSNE
jgi:hypothetical protein